MLRYLICCFTISLILFLPPISAAASPSFSFLYSLTSKCLLSFHPTTSLLHVNGDHFEKALASKDRNSHTAVLFYAFWCPFSQAAYVNFKALSFMYPHIEHLAVEQSSAMPSLFSRYGIHSLPAILMVNGNSRRRFHGSAELDSLIEFYKRTSAPRILYAVRPIWASYQPRINLEIFGETCQILGHILHITDLKRVWSKLRICKTRNFHRSARNAQVWASLASVSLGKTSTSS